MDYNANVWVHVVVEAQEVIGVHIGRSGFSQSLMFGFAARSNDVILFPGKIFDACELTRQLQMLLEIIAIAFQGCCNDVRDVLRPKDGGNALVLFVEFGHGDTSRQVGLKSLYFYTAYGILVVVLGAIWTSHHTWI